MVSSPRLSSRARRELASLPWCFLKFSYSRLSRVSRVSPRAADRWTPGVPPARPPRLRTLLQTVGRLEAGDKILKTNWPTQDKLRWLWSEKKDQLIKEYIEELIDAGDKIVVTLSISGCHPINGEKISFRDVTILTLKNGKIISQRGVSDLLSLLKICDTSMPD